MRKGIRSRVETKAKLEELKRQMEIDFESKYKAFKGIDQGMRTSESRLKNLIAMKRRNNPVASFKGNISEETVQQTLDHYSAIYNGAMRTSIRNTDKEVKEYMEKMASPLDAIKFNGIELKRNKTTYKSHVIAEMKAITSYNRNSNLNCATKGGQKSYKLNVSGKSCMLSFN